MSRVTELEKALSELFHKGTLVVFCNSYKKAKLHVDFLADFGYTTGGTEFAR